MIGFCGLVAIAPDDRRAVIGNSLARAHWGRGYAPEAARAMLECAFAALGFNRIEAYCTAENAASIGVLERVGMRREGVLRAHTTITGRPRDRAVYGMLRCDWPTDEERVPERDERVVSRPQYSRRNIPCSSRRTAARTPVRCARCRPRRSIFKTHPYRLKKGPK